jgi:hypothetical protein
MNHPTLQIHDGEEGTSPDLHDEVKELQTLLNGFGFNLPVNGIFDEVTQTAVESFQTDHDLASDGIVGPQTWGELTSAGATAPPDSTFSTTISNDNLKMRAQFTEALKYKAFIDDGAQKIELPSVVIAGIGSRESGWGLLLRPPGPGGTGDFGQRRFPTTLRTGPLPPDGAGYGRGLMQIDFDFQGFARSGNWMDPQANINYGCNLLKSNRDFLGSKTSLTGRDLLQAAVAAYNSGTGNVLKAINEGQPVDSFTTGKDYSKDVFNRAGFFQNMGWDSQTVSAGS